MDAIKHDSTLTIIEVTVADLINKKYKINFEILCNDWKLHTKYLVKH